MYGLGIKEPSKDEPSDTLRVKFDGDVTEHYIGEEVTIQGLGDKIIENASYRKKLEQDIGEDNYERLLTLMVNMYL